MTLAKTTLEMAMIELILPKKQNSTKLAELLPHQQLSENKSFRYEPIIGGKQNSIKK